jgi:hypothetical protein
MYTLDGQEKHSWPLRVYEWTSSTAGRVSWPSRVDILDGREEGFSWPLRVYTLKDQEKHSWLLRVYTLNKREKHFQPLRVYTLNNQECQP